LSAAGHCGGTLHSCGSEPAQFNILPDKSGVPAETMRLDFLQYQGAPQDEPPPYFHWRRNQEFFTVVSPPSQNR
jgi:hypothetical protein